MFDHRDICSCSGLDLQRNFRGGVQSATVAERISHRVRQNRDIASGESQGRSTIDRNTELAFLNNMDASGAALEFNVEARPKFGCQHSLSVELNEPQNVGKKISVGLRIGRWSKNSVVGVMGFHEEYSICSSSEFDGKPYNT